jgi:hypothetical protein
VVVVHIRLQNAGIDDDGETGPVVGAVSSR